METAVGTKHTRPPKGATNRVSVASRPSPKKGGALLFAWRSASPPHRASRAAVRPRGGQEERWRVATAHRLHRPAGKDFRPLEIREILTENA